MTKRMPPLPLDPIERWGKRESVPVERIPTGEFACLSARDGSLVVIYREFTRDGAGRPMLGQGRSSWRVQPVTTAPPGHHVRPVDFDGLTAIEQLFFAERVDRPGPQRHTSIE